MNSYIYEITNTITNEKYIGIRKCEGDIYEDKYKGEDTFIPKFYRKYGKKNFVKRVLSVIVDDKMVNELIDIYMKYSDYILIDDKAIAEFKVERTTVGAKNGMARKVICLNTGEIFDTITEAAKRYNTDKTGITHACGPNPKREVAGKDKDGNYLRWSYYDDYIGLQGDNNNE